MAHATLVVGSQWGDEGKGKLIDILAETADLCLRTQGGNNAGVLHPKCRNLIGSGCIVHVPSFLKELQTLKDKDLDPVNRLFISDKAHIDFDLHTAVDRQEEVELGKDSIGTTKKGIGPTFSSKAARNGLRIEEIFDWERFETRLRLMAVGYQKRYGELLNYDVEEELSRFKKYTEILAPFIVDELPLLRSVKQQKLTVVCEGAQASMLNITFGTYPFVTSSNCTVGGMLAGSPIGWQSIKEVVGVVKAYTTRVGSGPFPTEQLNEYGEKLQQVGREVGVTTGRIRRCGHLDLVQIRYSEEINGWTAINLTKLDILDDFDEIPVAVGYKYNGEELESFPASLQILENVEITYKALPGWKSKTSDTKNFEELPENARKYIAFVEEFVGVKIKYIGTGPGREDLIRR